MAEVCHILNSTLPPAGQEDTGVKEEEEGVVWTKACLTQCLYLTGGKKKRILSVAHLSQPQKHVAVSVHCEPGRSISYGYEFWGRNRVFHVGLSLSLLPKWGCFHPSDFYSLFLNSTNVLCFEDFRAYLHFVRLSVCLSLFSVCLFPAPLSLAAYFCINHHDTGKATQFSAPIAKVHGALKRQQEAWNSQAGANL